MIFDYPAERDARRHGPSGYASYDSYRPWLRDEFDFRCVYCLKREVWGHATGDFELDHFEPQSTNPNRRLDYLNLVYACRCCNSVKQDQLVEDPFGLLTAPRVRVLPDGTLSTTSVAAKRLMLQLDLNSPRLKSWRLMWLRIIVLAEERDADLFHKLVGVPDNLPDLRRLRPPQNSHQAGIEQSWFARRRRGELLQLP